MGVKDVYGKEARERNHMILAHSPTTLLIEELRKRKMSDREIMDSKPNWSYKDTKVKIPKVKHHPDAYKHQVVSFIKSGVRILGYSLLIVNLPIAVTTLIFSEVIGIIEELV